MFNALGRPISHVDTLENDIKACFCQNSNEYLLKEIAMDKLILHKLLKSGFMEKNQLYRPGIS
jgi:retron-type reverse transcriptase